MQGFGSGGPRGGRTKVITVTPTISTSAYTVGDWLGGKMTFSDAARALGGTGVILGITVLDKDAENSVISVYLFEEDPASTTFTDNAAGDLADADLDNLIGSVEIGATDYSEFVDNAVFSRGNLWLPFQCAAGSNDLYGAMVTRTATTYATTTDIIVKLRVLQD